MSRDALLVLENGAMFAGTSFGAEGEAFAEIVFNTSMTGYQEILTDPSYAGQIVVMTAPMIGNTGVNAEDIEANKPACAGMAIRELSAVPSSWRSSGDLHGYLASHGLVGIEGIDTRALTRALRDEGAMRGAISTDAKDAESLLSRVRSSPSMIGQDLASVVTCPEPYSWEEPSWSPPDCSAPSPMDMTRHIVAYDFGIKQNILRELRDIGCRITVVPADTPPKDALALKGDGYFLSNGPGDPAAVVAGIEAARGLVRSGAVVFGICLGHQVLSLALGAKTFKLPFGHHGGNHPVLDMRSGKVAITSQNHGFAVDAESLPDDIEMTHKNLYDGTVEGIAHNSKPVFAIQYHPEASPGPHDASYLFAQFAKVVDEAKR